MCYTSFWQSALFRRIMLLSVFTLLLSASSLLFSQHASAHTQDAPQLYASDYYQYNYYNQKTSFVGVSFSPNSAVTLIWRLDAGGDIPAGTATTDANGGFTFKIANMPSLPYSMQAQQPQGTLIATDAQGLQASFLVAETPGVIPSASNVIDGDTVTLNAGGYAANEPVNILLNNVTGTASTVIATMTANAQGGFNSAFVIPNTAHVGDNIEVIGANSKLDLLPQPNVTVSLKIAISPSRGPAGTSVTVSGAMYTPGGQITLDWINQSITPTTFTIASDGTLQAQFTVPSNAIAGHNYNVRVTDITTDYAASTRFTVTS